MRQISKIFLIIILIIISTTFIKAEMVFLNVDKNTGEVQYIKYLIGDIISDRLQYYKGWIYAARGVGVYVVDPKTGEIVHSVRGGYKIAVGNDRIFCQDSDKIRCLDIFRAEDTVETNTKIF